MSDINDILADLDPDQAEAIKAAFKAKDDEGARQIALAQRDKRLATDKSLRSKYPLAASAFDEGDLTLPDDLSDDALEAALKGKQERLERMGLKPPAAGEETEGDGAAAFGEPRGAAAPGADPVSALHAVEAAITGDQKLSDRAFIRELHKLQKEPGGAEKINDLKLTYQAEAHPNSVTR